MSKAVDNNEISLDDIFNQNNDDNSQQPSEINSSSNSNVEGKKEANSNDTSNVKLDSEENHELTEDLGPIDSSYVEIDKNDASEIKSFAIDFHIENGEKVYNNDAIVAMVDVKESFAEDENDYSEVKVRLKNNDHDNKVIQHVFGPYGVKNFDMLKKLTNPDNFSAAVNQWHNNGAKFQFPIYRSSAYMENKKAGPGEDPQQLVTFYKFTNRPGGSRNTYSKHYDEHGGFPTTPDSYLNSEVDPDTNILYGQILSTNMNERFKRFEVEFLPVTLDNNGNVTPLSESGSDRFKKHLDENDIYSYISFYKYADRNDDSKIDKSKRSNQASKVSAGLGVADYKDWNTAVGSIRPFNIRSFDSTRVSGGKVFRAYLK